MSGLVVPAGHQNGLVSWEALALHLYGDVGQHVPAAEPVEVEQDVARVARELNTAICRHGHSVNLGRGRSHNGNHSGYQGQEIDTQMLVLNNNRRMITNNTLNGDTFFRGEMDPIALVIMNIEVLFSVFVGSTVPGRGIPRLWLSIRSRLFL